MVVSALLADARIEESGDVSLLHGWLPTSIQLLALVLAVGMVARRGRRWWTLWVPLALAVGITVGVLSRWYSRSQGMTGAPLPWILWLWFGLAAVGAVISAVGWTFGRHWQQVVAVATTLVALLSAGSVLNQWTGYLKTVGQAYEAAVAAPLSGEVRLGALDDLRGKPRSSGVLVHVHAPTPVSGFTHRDEVVYLPPAWFARTSDQSSPPTLPVVVLIGGAFNTPEDWIRNGRANVVADEYAAAHDGRAPILVMADVSGSMGTDTECVDGPRGKTATYAARDLPAYIEDAFGASRNPADWAVAGWSMGGTCAIVLATVYPDRYRTFLDIAGDLTPNAGAPDDTLARLYGGDRAALDRFDPVTAMRAHGPYPGTAGRFVDGLRSGGASGLGGLTDALFGPDTMPLGPEPSSVLCPEARSHGIDCEVVHSPLPHQWSLAEQVFRQNFDWMAGRIGTLGRPG